MQPPLQLREKIIVCADINQVNSSWGQSAVSVPYLTVLSLMQNDNNDGISEMLPNVIT